MGAYQIFQISYNFFRILIKNHKIPRFFQESVIFQGFPHRVENLIKVLSPVGTDESPMQLIDFHN